MKFICDGASLSGAVAKTSKACAVRTTAPIMECVLVSATVDGVELSATDGELSIRKKIRAEIFEEGAVCVPGKLFSDFLSKLSDAEVTLQTGERGMEICYGDSGSAMQALPAEEFPKLDFEIGENSFRLKRSDFKKLVQKTVFCCAQDDSRPILKGCLLECGERLEATALDGYRLALASAELTYKSGERSFICPGRTLTEIARMLSDEGEVTVYTQGGMLLVSAEDATVLSRLYQGEFIRKESVLPPDFSTRVLLSRTELIASAERAAVLIRGDKNNLITLEIGGGKVNLKGISDLGKVAETVRAEISGKDLTISMNAKFLLDALRALEENEIEISLNGPLSPFTLQNSGRKDGLYLILPVRNAQ